jgi:hypothetical protein
MEFAGREENYRYLLANDGLHRQGVDQHPAYDHARWLGLADLGSPHSLTSKLALDADQRRIKMPVLNFAYDLVDDAIATNRQRRQMLGNILQKCIASLHRQRVGSAKNDGKLAIRQRDRHSHVSTKEVVQRDQQVPHVRRLQPNPAALMTEESCVPFLPYGVTARFKSDNSAYYRRATEEGTRQHRQLPPEKRI